MSKALDITGQRFGKLVAISKAPSRSGKTYWLCQCDCGKQKEVQTNHLVNGSIQSCGCLKKSLDKEKEENCLYCHKPLHKGQYKYCSLKCQSAYQREQDVQKIFDQEISGLKNATTSSPKIKDTLRTYLLKKHNYCCELCGCNWINPYSNSTILEIHHIDGNRNNNTEENLQVLCPNCHAMTPNYKGLNVKR